MHHDSPSAVRTRRRLLQGAAALGTVGLIGAPARAALLPTARQGMGPFYPDRLPLDTDNDLVRIAGRDAGALGDVSHVFGTVRDTAGRALTGAQVEIWQCDARGRYIHSADARRGGSDDAFQGYGRTLTDADGGYRFRTIRPVPYPGRAPHIHVLVTTPDGRRLVTQMYVAGAPENARDRLLNGVRDPAQRAALIVEFAPAPQFEADALGGRFDIVLAG